MITEIKKIVIVQTITEEGTATSFKVDGFTDFEVKRNCNSSFFKYIENGFIAVYYFNEKSQKFEPNTDFKTIEDLIPYNLEILKMRSKIAKIILKHQKKKEKQLNTLKDCTANIQENKEVILVIIFKMQARFRIS